MRTPLLLLLLACAQDPVDALESYAGDICACEDADCIESTRERWEQENVQRIATAKLSESETSRGEAAIEKALDCQSSIRAD
jgi:hypothetical protein